VLYSTYYTRVMRRCTCHRIKAVTLPKLSFSLCVKARRTHHAARAHRSSHEASSSHPCNRLVYSIQVSMGLKASRLSTPHRPGRDTRLELSIAPDTIPSIPPNLRSDLPLQHINQIDWSGSAYLNMANDDPLQIRLVKYISSGRLWDVYRGEIVNPITTDTSITSSVIVKVCCPANMLGKYGLCSASCENSHASDTDAGEYGTDSANRALYRELSALQGRLQDLQGVMVPTVVGNWSASIRGVMYHVFVMEDCGNE
jgi:hypothetical protein